MTADPSTIAAAAVIVIAALSGMVVQIVNALFAARDRRLAAEERRALIEQTKAVVQTGHETAAKADVIIHKATQIETLTNGTNSELTKSLQVAQMEIKGTKQEIAGLREMIAQLLQAKQDTATALATVVMPPRLPDTPRRAADLSAERTLAAIEQNTSEIAANTKPDPEDG